MSNRSVGLCGWVLILGACLAGWLVEPPDLDAVWAWLFAAGVVLLICETELEE